MAVPTPYLSGCATILVFRVEIAEDEKNQIFLSVWLTVMEMTRTNPAHICFRKVFDYCHFERRTLECKYFCILCPEALWCQKTAQNGKNAFLCPKKLFLLFCSHVLRARANFLTTFKSYLI